jgi:hypothetical protein
MAEQLSIDWSLDDIERRILTLLRARRGRSQAIKVPELAGLLHSGNTRPRPKSKTIERNVQEVIRRLREQHGCPILSSAGKPPGYWWAATAEELEQCIREQRRKAISTLVVLRALRRHRAHLAGQQDIAA